MVGVHSLLSLLALHQHRRGLRVVDAYSCRLWASVAAEHRPRRVLRLPPAADAKLGALIRGHLVRYACKPYTSMHAPVCGSCVWDGRTCCRFRAAPRVLNEARMHVSQRHMMLHTHSCKAHAFHHSLATRACALKSARKRLVS